MGSFPEQRLVIEPSREGKQLERWLIVAFVFFTYTLVRFTHRRRPSVKLLSAVRTTYNGTRPVPKSTVAIKGHAINTIFLNWRSSL